MIVLLLVTNLATYSLTTGLIPWVGYRWGGGLLGGAGDFGRLHDQYRILLSEYVEELDGRKLIEGALAGMADAVGDRYTYYMDPQEYQEFSISLTGEYVGVGMVVEQRDNYVVVVRPFPGSPAEQGGLRTNDRIIGVDGQDVVGMPSEEVAGMIRGVAGTPVVLTILRGAATPQEERFDVTLVRQRIILESALGKMLSEKEGIGYIQITEFSLRTPEQFNAALADLKARGLRALVLDLRNNGGGYLDECITIARQFVGGGTILHRVSRTGKTSTVSANGGAALKVPVVVLVNQLTASAAEILAGAIKDNEAGVVVGVTTFGKGSIQRAYKLGGGSHIRLTTERWLTPAGVQISEHGIEPHETVALPELGADGQPIDWAGFTWDDPDDPRDTQLRRALEILRDALAQNGG